jgi:hypothetical protein
MGGGLSRKAVFLGSFNQIWNSLKFICSWEVINKLKSSKHKPERQYAFTSTALFIRDNEKKKHFYHNFTFDPTRIKMIALCLYPA